MRKKAVKVRKWVTCSEPGCKRRAGTAKPYCREHQQQFEEKKTAAAALRKRRRLFHEARVQAKKPKKAREAAKATSPRAERAAIRPKWLDLKAMREKEAAARQSLPPSSRLIKAYCEKCNYTIRLSRKWIDVKRPMCPACLKNMVTELDGLIDADPRQLKLKGGV